MPCYDPRKACLVSSPSGKSISFSRNSVGKALSLPCGRCSGCRAERARQWAVRLLHESECHEDSGFLTLTFNAESYPSDGSLSVPVAQLFMKRLRARIAPVKVRFFLVGEYGEKTFRAHYHLLLFGYDFPDKTVLSETPGQTLFTSKLLDSIWGFGFCSIGSVTFSSALYVAKYATKKMFGPKAAAYYRGRTPEFSLMSRRKGIGRAWIDKFASDVYPSDEVIIQGYPARPPRYYDQVLESSNPELLESIKVKREIAAEALTDEVVLLSGKKIIVNRSRNVRRLETRRIVAEAKASLKSRSLEELQ